MPARTPAPPIGSADLERLALRYVERFATSSGRLEAYLRRKLRERGAGEGLDPDAPARVAAAMVARGYVDDAAFAGMRASGMARRGYGRSRVAAALRHDGIAAETLAETLVGHDAAEAALAFARRRRIGPFAAEPADPDRQRRQLATMLRAGHPPQLARRIVRLPPGEVPDPETLV